VLFQHRRVEHGNELTEDDRVGHLHHCGLEVHREQHARLFGIFNLRGDKFAQGFLAHDRSVEQFAREHLGRFFQHLVAAILSYQLDTHAARLSDFHRLFAAVKVAGAHVRDMRLRISGPSAHLVRILAGVVLDRQRRAAVGIAFAQHRIHGRTLDLVVTGLDGLLVVIGRGIRVIRQLIALGLQFLDRGFELRDRGADIGQLDDVGFRGLGQFAQFGQMIANALGFVQVFRKARNDAASQGNVSGFNGNARRLCERLHDGEQRCSCQRRRFVGLGVDDFGGSHFEQFSVVSGSPIEGGFSGGSLTRTGSRPGLYPVMPFRAFFPIHHGGSQGRLVIFPINRSHHRERKQ